MGLPVSASQSRAGLSWLPVRMRELSGLNNAALEVQIEADAAEEDVIERFRQVIPELGVDPQTISVERGRTTSLGRALGAGGADLAVRIRGQELDSLIVVAEQVADRLLSVGRVSDPRIDLQLVQPELDIEVNRDAAARRTRTPGSSPRLARSRLRLPPGSPLRRRDLR